MDIKLLEEMERCILNSMLEDPFILKRAKNEGYTPEMFPTLMGQKVARVLWELSEGQKDLSGIDYLTVKNEIISKKWFDEVMQKYLESVKKSEISKLDKIIHYLNILKEHSQKRRLKEVAERIEEFLESGESNQKFDEFIGAVINELRDIQKSRVTKRISVVREEMKEILEDIERREREGEIEVIGYSIAPFNVLNKTLSGLRRGFFYAIAGAPRRGKTTFALELATAVAANNKIPVLYFTWEQTKKNLTYRLLAKESRLNPDTLQRKKIKSDIIMEAKFLGGWKKMQRYMDYLHIIEATKEDTVEKIKAYAYNTMQEFNTDKIVIFLDYLQKIPLSQTYLNEKFKVEEVSTALKGLSIELNCPIVAISSLNKEGCDIDARPDNDRPTMYHCKGSGDIEYDLDVAMIQGKDWGDTKELYQQLVYKAQQLGKDYNRVPKVDVINLYIDKNRDAPEGTLGTIQYFFFIEDNKFFEIGYKIETDHHRFARIEKWVNKLIEQNYITFYDMEEPQQPTLGTSGKRITIFNI